MCSSRCRGWCLGSIYVYFDILVSVLDSCTVILMTWLLSGIPPWVCDVVIGVLDSCMVIVI